MKRLWGFLCGKHFGIPSVFDIGVIAFIVGLPLLRIPGYNRIMITSMFIIFGIIALMAISAGIKKQRDYKSSLMTVLVLWCMVHVFWHSFKGVEVFGSMMINWILLNEGFIYIYLGIFLILTIVRYAKAWGWYYPALIFSTMYAWKNIFDINKDADWSMTPILAGLISFTVVLLMRFKKWWLTLPVIGVFTGVVIYKWDYIWKVKWISRPDFWKVCLERLKASKFLGKGYYHTVNTADGFVAGHELEGGGLVSKYVLERWGKGWRQNDLLEFGEYMGIIAMIAVVAIFGCALWKGKPGLAYFFVLAVAIMCVFQRTMYIPVKGALITIMLSMLILERKAGWAG